MFFSFLAVFPLPESYQNDPKFHFNTLLRSDTQKSSKNVENTTVFWSRCETVFGPPPAKADIATAILTNVIEHLVLLFCPPISTPSPPKRCGRIYLKKTFAWALCRQLMPKEPDTWFAKILVAVCCSWQCWQVSLRPSTLHPAHFSQELSMERLLHTISLGLTITDLPSTPRTEYCKLVEAKSRKNGCTCQDSNGYWTARAYTRSQGSCLAQQGVQCILPLR